MVHGISKDRVPTRIHMELEETGVLEVESPASEEEQVPTL